MIIFFFQPLPDLRELIGQAGILVKADILQARSERRMNAESSGEYVLGNSVLGPSSLHLFLAKSPRRKERNPFVLGRICFSLHRPPKNFLQMEPRV